ncbi:MAG: glycosyltransferase [Candidatus Beckwithbacteria bacterium]|nr:glycosyltransferase [Candidatus Beckwithbacteria bacterium]
MKKWQHQYYHERIRKTFSFIIPPNKKILFLGADDAKILDSLCPTKGTVAINSAYENYLPKEKFDYIILNGVLGQTTDMLRILKNILRACHPSTRILIYQYNYLWQGILALAEKLGLKRKEGVQNWLSVNDLRTYLEGVNFQVTRVFRRTIFPLNLFGLGRLFNFISVLIPFFDFFKLDQFIIGRSEPYLFPKALPESLTICITVRNEKGNIEPIVKSIPRICDQQEILFVEGHSTDGTRKEIFRMINQYPHKNIRVMGQPGIGQGDATRVGFKAAKGEIIIIYEGDGTSDPGDIDYFYQAMKTGRFEFIEGTRFVYPKGNKAMPLVNQLGNIVFAKWFSFFLGQRTTDVLSGIKSILKRDYNLLYQRWGFLGFQDPFGDFELLYGAARMGLKIGEIPIRYYPRTYGETKTKPLTHGFYLLKMAAKGYLIFRNN